MRRVGVLASVGGIVIGLGPVAGCANTWETITSRDFKDKILHKPADALFHSDDPLHVLRTNPEGGMRAKAMNRLKEPLASGGSQAEQDEVVEQILGPTATSDPSPVLRAAAIDALGRFKDPRAAQILATAYMQASGRAPGATPPAAPSVQQVSGVRKPGGEPGLLPRYDLTGPSGFPADTVVMLRAKAIDGLAKTGRPEAIVFLSQVATAPQTGEEATDRDTRLAAVRGLTSIRSKEVVPALAKVLQEEANKDVALASRAHMGLVNLTGRDLPADPEKWNQVVQTGYEIAPAPTVLGQIADSLDITK